MANITRLPGTQPGDKDTRSRNEPDKDNQTKH